MSNFFNFLLNGIEKHQLFLIGMSYLLDIFVYLRSSLSKIHLTYW